MKLHEFLKQFEGLDPNMEILATTTPLIGGGLMEGYARERVIPFVRYVASLPKYGGIRRYYPFKTKRYSKAVYIITT